MNKREHSNRGTGGWDCYISLLCFHIISTLLRALRALAKIFNYISNTEARYNNACLKPKPGTFLCNIQNYCKTALAKSSVNEGR